MTDIQDKGSELDWDATEMVDDGGDFVILEQGTYPFIVESLTKKRFEGSSKMAPCPKAEIKLVVDAGAQGMVTVVESLLLNTKTQWRVARFFEALGFPKNPETNMVQINWSAILNRQGFAEIGPRTYTNDKGEQKQTNDVKKFLKPEEWPQQPAAAPVPAQMAAPVVAPVMQQPAPPVQQQMPVAQPAPHQIWQNPQGGSF